MKTLGCQTEWNINLSLLITHQDSGWWYAVWQHSCQSRYHQRLSFDSSPPVTCSSLQKHSKYVTKMKIQCFHSLVCNYLLKITCVCRLFFFMQTLGVLESMPSNKQYAELEESVNKAVQFIRYPGHCLRDGPRLLALLVNLLYPDLRYLHIIR